MASYLLGTGSGVLAAAAVYYTMSAHLAQDTTALQAELDRTTFLMNSSLDPRTPPAPVSQIGPSRNPYEPRFSDLIRSKWNQALERGVDSVRTTDWSSVAGGITESGRGVVRKISGEVDEAKPALERAERRAEEGGRRIVRDLQREAGDVAQKTEEVSENIFERVKSAVVAARETTAAAADDAGRTMGRAVKEAGQDSAELAHLAKEEVPSNIFERVKTAVFSAGETTAAAAEDAGRTLSRAVKEVGEDSAELAHLAKDKVVEKAQEVERAVEVNKRQREEYHEGILVGTSGPGIVSAAAEDLGKESFTGGAALKVRAKRQAEKTLAGRLV